MSDTERVCGRPLTPGQKMAGRAVTVRFVPARPDIAADKPAGMESPEYDAFEQVLSYYPRTRPSLSAATPSSRNNTNRAN